MAFMNWDNKLSVGVDRMDNQHKKLIDLVNEVYNAMSQGKGDDVLTNVLGSLVTYTKTHFKDEEQFMSQHKYPELESHKKLHRELEIKATELYGKVRGGQRVSAVSVGTFLKDWLLNHIMQQDKKYGRHVLQHSS